MKRMLAVICHAPSGDSPLEKAISLARRASAQDLIRSLRPLVPTLVVATPEGEDAAAFRALGVDVLPTLPDPWFQLGETLTEIVRNGAPEAILYFGSGSGSLLKARHFETLCDFANRTERAALLNNFYSCDFAVITDPGALLDAELPGEDNRLGFALAEAGLRCYTLPRDAASQFDIDVPTDLHLLRDSGRDAGALHDFLASWPPDHPTLRALTALLINRKAVVYLAGRIQPGTWQTFELATACRTGGFVEGRGMKASPNGRTPLLQGLVRDDPVRFFERLAAAADGAILDTRPLLAVGGSLPRAHDRFASDLFLAEDVANPHWRAFTEAARAASIPVLLGGHNLVSGGLFLLAEACWKGQSLPRRLHPDPFAWKEEFE